MLVRALCAWCSLPGNKKATPTKEWQYSTDFSEYHEEFPGLVTENGEGWYYRHVHALAEFYIANKQEQSEWVILPVTNIGAYLGSSSLGRQYLSKIPPELMERKQNSFGASVYKMRI